jgi:hypothetical protein
MNIEFFVFPSNIKTLLFFDAKIYFFDAKIYFCRFSALKTLNANVQKKRHISPILQKVKYKFLSMLTCLTSTNFKKF